VVEVGHPGTFFSQKGDLKKKNHLFPWLSWFISMFTFLVIVTH